MKGKPHNEIEDFELLFKENYELLCLVSYRIIKDRSAARDTVQDFFVYYWQKRNSILIKTSFQAYAFRAVRYMSIGVLKKRNEEKSMLKDLDNEVFDYPNHDIDFTSLKNVLELLNQMPKGRREIFESSVIHGMTYSEIAKLNGISVNTVKTQIKRAYAFFRARISKEDVFLSFLLLRIINI